VSELRYRKDVYPTGPNPVLPAPGECGIFRYQDEPNAVWYLCFGFIRTTDGQAEFRSIPVSPGSGPQDDIHSWGLNRVGPGRWQVSPSILCRDGGRDSPEVWHETPAIVDVPEGEPW